MAKYKYPRTPYLPRTDLSKDDLVADQLWLDEEMVVVTLKMDGENTTIGRDYIHARSLESSYHPSRTWVKEFAAKWQYKLKDNERICGENMYAVHSIYYDNLPSFFLGFSYWTDDWCHSWPDTEAKFKELGIERVPVQCIADFGSLSMRVEGAISIGNGDEGFVVRTYDGFPYSAFHMNVAKWVRPGHVQEDEGHWMTKDNFKMNKLAPPG